MNKKHKSDMPAVRPSRAVCERCVDRGICPAESGMMNYICPKVVDKKAK